MLTSAQAGWEAGLTKVECLTRAHEAIEARTKQARDEGLDVDMRLDFLEFNDADSFDEIGDNATKKDFDVVLLSGALFVDKTRLIDNLILGDVGKILQDE
jgi:pantoate--beta-alanine ligase